MRCILTAKLKDFVLNFTISISFVFLEVCKLMVVMTSRTEKNILQFILFINDVKNDFAYTLFLSVGILSTIRGLFQS